MALTQVVGAPHVEDVVAVDVLVQGLLYQVLGLVARQVIHPKMNRRKRYMNYNIIRLLFL